MISPHLAVGDGALGFWAALREVFPDTREQSPDMLPGEHERTRPSLNHLALHAGDRDRVDALTAAAPTNGWTLMFPDRHPHAGRPQHYAAYLTDADGYEVELVADDT